MGDMSFDLETVLSVLLGGFMVVGFFVNIPAKDTTRAQFKLWGYPEWFHSYSYSRAHSCRPDFLSRNTFIWLSISNCHYDICCCNTLAA
ncbi:hypothetical protein ALT721_1800008 [Alteromonas alvinellae]